MVDKVSFCFNLGGSLVRGEANSPSFPARRHGQCFCGFCLLFAGQSLVIIEFVEYRQRQVDNAR
jgi:hypothetical protein